MDFRRWRSQCPRCWGRGDLPQGWKHHTSLTALASCFVPLHKLWPLMGCRQGGEAHRPLLVLHMLLAGLRPWLAFRVLLRVDGRTQLPEVEGPTPWAPRGSSSPDGHLWSISVTSRQFASGLTSQVRPIQEGLPGDRCGPSRRVSLGTGAACPHGSETTGSTAALPWFFLPDVPSPPCGERPSRAAGPHLPPPSTSRPCFPSVPRGRL